MKKCNLCGELKDASWFYAHKQSKDGLQGKCKECAKAGSKRNRMDKIDYYKKYDAWRFKNDPKVKARHVDYRKKPHYQDVITRLRNEWNDRNPEKVLANAIVSRAVRSGKLYKPDNCSCCGLFTPSRMLHGHHHDYSLPLDVTWLCVSCHAAMHYNE